MEKKYKKIFNNQGRIEYVEDIDGRYTEKDFEGEFVLKGNLEKSEEIINKEKKKKENNYIYFIFAIFLILVVAFMGSAPDVSPRQDTDTEYRYSEEEENCYKLHTKNYPTPPTADEIKNSGLMPCLDRVRNEK